jgi:DNA-binding beta-propeller fold protein YncE
MNGLIDSLNLDYTSIGIVSLPKDKLISANYDEKCLTIHDKEYRLIKKIDRINGREFAPIAIAFDAENQRLYIAEYDMNRITICDLEFNEINSLGSYGNKNDQFDGLIDICYTDKKLYACDNGNNRIKIFNENLKFKHSFYSDSPQKIKVSNLSICVLNATNTTFYKLNGFMKESYDRTLSIDPDLSSVCRLSEINSVFYVTNYIDKTITCYNKRGNPKDEEPICLIGLDDYLADPFDGYFISHQDDILMTSYSKKKLIRFSKIFIS